MPLRNRRRAAASAMVDEDGTKNKKKKEENSKDLGDSTAKRSPRKKQSAVEGQSSQPSDYNLRRSRRRAKISVEVTVTTSDEEESADEAEVAAEFFARQASMDQLEGDTSVPANYDTAAVMATNTTPSLAPRFYEMTPQLLEAVMAPVRLYQSPSEDGLDKELRLRLPVDFSGGCVGVCDVLFNEHLGVKIDGATDWMPVNFVGDYMDPESVQIPDGLAVQIDESLGLVSGRQVISKSSAPRSTQSSLRCNEEFGGMAAVLDMNSWMQKVIHRSTASCWLWEHDYGEPNMKFGRPRSVNILQDAISAFNKYVNFIRLSERREPFLFGLWWEKEDTHGDYWLLPRPRDDDGEFDRKSSTVILPIANEWTEEVVVASEETVDYVGANGVVTPMTFWDNRGFLSFAAWSGLGDEEKHDRYSTGAADTSFKKPLLPKDAAGVGGGSRRRSTTTPVARAPRFLAPKLDPKTAFMYEGKLNASGLPDNLEELVDTIQKQQNDDIPNDGMIHSPRLGGPAFGGGVTQGKNMSKERLDEIDFAMRCIKELQQRRTTTSSCRLHCRICSREFTAPTSLIVHYRSHAGIKPFTCPLCMSSFTRRHSLKYHMLCHSGQARFRCGLCDRLFRHSGHYRDHMRKHEQGMPFRCADCNRVFATRTTFRRHLAVIHNTTEPRMGRGRSVGVSKLYADMEGMEMGELGEVAEEIEYDGEEIEDEDENDIDAVVAEEVRASAAVM